MTQRHILEEQNPDVNADVRLRSSLCSGTQCEQNERILNEAMRLATACNSVPGVLNSNMTSRRK